MFALRSGAARGAARVLALAQAQVATSPQSAPPVIKPNVAEILKHVKPKLVIDGEFVEAASGKTFPVIDPRTEQVVLDVAEADAEDVNRAVKAARRAFDEGPWPRMSGRERGRILLKFAYLLEQHQEELSRLETLVEQSKPAKVHEMDVRVQDNGKPLMVSRHLDVPFVIDHIRYFAGCADKIHGKTIPVDGSFFAYTLHEPMGVIGQVTSTLMFSSATNVKRLVVDYSMELPAFDDGIQDWSSLSSWKYSRTQGAEQTPLTALRAAELALEAGIPKGVLNVLPGYGPTAGTALAKHMDVDKVAFTGSTEVGRKIMQMASGNLKNISLELGGKSPVIVFPDVDIDYAVKQAHHALFINQGQCCTAGSRLYVHADIYDNFVEKAAQVASNMVVGDPFDNVDQGPQIDAEQFSKILRYLDSGKTQGAELVCGGQRIGQKGYYIEPTVFADVRDEMKIARDEIFGPVQSILKFDDAADVIKRANDTTYGLVAGVFTNDIDLANRVSRSIRAGSVWVNTYHQYDHALPFGGYKMSGIGREKSVSALKHYMEVKTITMPLKDSPCL